MSVVNTIKEMLGLRDQKLATSFDEKPYDPTKDRAKLKKRLQKTFDQYQSATPTKGRKDYSVNHKGEVRYTSPFPLGGDSEHHFADGGKFQEFLAHFSQNIDSGAFDADLESSKIATPAASTGERKQRAGWSPERRAAFAATQAAKKKA